MSYFTLRVRGIKLNKHCYLLITQTGVKPLYIMYSELRNCYNAEGSKSWSLLNIKKHVTFSLLCVTILIREKWIRKYIVTRER